MHSTNPFLENRNCHTGPKTSHQTGRTLQQNYVEIIKTTSSGAVVDKCCVRTHLVYARHTYVRGKNKDWMNKHYKAAEDLIVQLCPYTAVN